VNDPVTADLTLRAEETGFVPVGTELPRFNLQTVDPGLKTPYQDEFTAGFERELWTESSVHLTVVHRTLHRRLLAFDLNHLPGDFGRCVPGGSSVVPVTLPSDPLYGLYPAGGDGTLDDCNGDGMPDLYTMNPYWGDVFRVGNGGDGEYGAYVLEFERRQYRGWQMNASYTFSRLTADGSRYDPSAGDGGTLLEHRYGPEPNDRRHDVRIAATTITPWGFHFGFLVRWRSGLPYSVLEERIVEFPVPPLLDGYAGTDLHPRLVYATGKRNDRRNPAIWDLDVKVVKEMNLPRGLNLQIAVEVFNLLDDESYLIHTPHLGYGRRWNGHDDATRRYGRRYQMGITVRF
jgi:hypothetical protein